MAESYGKVGQIEDGLRALAEALAIVDQTGECVYESELHRLKGELTIQQANQKSKVKNQKLLIPTPHGEAEACFLKAIDIARRQSAKSLELRATMSLARLCQRQGKHHEAHRMLSEIYNWFTEGFDTKDLREAKTLLESLGSSI
jgi:predicted ATPase